MSQRKKWSELNVAQKGSISFGVVLQVTIAGMALWDMWHRSPEQINGNRRLWTLAMGINYLGPIAYFLFGRKDDA